MPHDELTHNPNANISDAECALNLGSSGQAKSCAQLLMTLRGHF